jgi:hypothetical protein
VGQGSLDYNRAMRRILLTAACLFALPLFARAAAWPDDWLGPPDNHYVNLRLGVFYYGAVLDDIPDDKGASPLPLGGTAPDGTPLPTTKDEWLQRLGALQDEGTRQADMNLVRRQLSETAQFYWRNTRFNCALTFDYVNQDADAAWRPTLRSSLDKADAPYYTPLGFTQDDTLRADPRFDGLLQISVLYRYNPHSGKLERVRGGGGFTEGAVLPPVGPQGAAAAGAAAPRPPQRASRPRNCAASVGGPRRRRRTSAAATGCCATSSATSSTACSSRAATPSSGSTTWRAARPTSRASASTSTAWRTSCAACRRRTGWT